MEAAKTLGGELGHSVDIPRRERPQALVEPNCSRAGLLTDVLRDHQ
jgi:hypothetical protein